MALALSISACFASNPEYEAPAESASSTSTGEATRGAGSETSGYSTGTVGGSTVGASTSGMTSSVTSSVTSGMTAVMTAGSTFPATSDSSITTTSGEGSSTGGFPEECDPYQQNCGNDTKCTAKDDNNDGYLDELTCAGYGPKPLGDPCQVDLMSGNDTCGLGLACVKGTCREICSGSEENPSCNQGLTKCFLYKEILPICVPTCTPPGFNECDEGVCVPSPYSEGFVCAPAGLNGTVGDPCDFVTDCELGLFCAPPGAVPCDDDSCCTPFCNEDEDPVICMEFELDCISLNNELFPGLGFCGSP